MRRLALGALAALVLSLAARAQTRLLDPAFPLEASASFPGGLFHWVDSLAGTTAGKTVPAHRRDYVARFGRVTPEDRSALEDFVAARAAHVTALRASHVRPENGPVVSALLGIFCGAATLDEALARAGRDMAPEDVAMLRRALQHFRPRYEKVWDGGRVPEGFLVRSRSDPRREELGRFLARVAAFYGVAAPSDPPPRVVLLPVPGGYGTHAEAIGRYLLIEVRDGETLADQAEVIVHENAHLLFERIPEPRRKALAAAMGEAGATGDRAWSLLHEALPTALGQGVAGRTFRPAAWSRREPWYHTADVDLYAKAIHPLVDRALAAGRPFDEAFVRSALELLPKRALLPAEGSPPGGVSPRSP